MKKEVLIILHPNFEEIEAVTPIDILRRAGLIVHIASTSNDLEVQSKGGIQIKADSLLSDHEHAIYDALVIPGGPGIFKIRDHSMIQKKIREFHKLKKCIACICAAPLLLLDQGLNQTFAMTCHPSVQAEFPALHPEATVRDKHIITSKGAGTAVPFALAIIEYLLNKEIAQNIADAICI
ncbi:MAG: protease [Puniceicoccaceae bacterium]|nr:protease [Puniceicoccaceae bacterium]